MNTTATEVAAVEAAAPAPAVKLTKSQARAVEWFRAFMQRQLNTNPDYGDTVDRFEVTVTDYGTVWVTATTDMVKLGEGNLLRALDRQHWHVEVGARGSLTAWSCPKSFRQFAGRRAMGLNFHKLAA